MLLSFGPALIFVLQRVVERGVQAEFDNRKKCMQLLLARRSRLEGKMLLALNDELQGELKKVFGLEAIRWDSLGAGAR
jgi:hypothetical protein